MKTLNFVFTGILLAIAGPVGACAQDTPPGVGETVIPLDVAPAWESDTGGLVTGDWCEEMLVISGDELQIYQNATPNPRPDRERLWQRRVYRLDRATWNYYSP